MIRKFAMFAAACMMSAHLCGCVALVAGAAGGIGTATWLSGKLSQEVNASFSRSLEGTKSALNSLHLKVTKETVKEDVAQILSNYSDGRMIWIDIHHVSDTISRVEIRVGAGGDKAAAHRNMDAILRHL